MKNFSFSDDEHFELCMAICNQTNHDVEWKFQMNTGDNEILGVSLIS